MEEKNNKQKFTVMTHLGAVHTADFKSAMKVINLIMEIQKLKRAVDISLSELQKLKEATDTSLNAIKNKKDKKDWDSALKDLLNDKGGN